MAPSKNQYDSIEDESKALIVDKSDNGESSQQSKFSPSVIRGFLGVVALFCMVLAANHVSEMNGVRGDIALVNAQYGSLADTVSTSGVEVGIYCVHDNECGDGNFCDRKCMPKGDTGGVCLGPQWCKSNSCNNYACVAKDDPTQCSKRSDQSDYRGKITTTTHGKICQTWSSQSPHKHGNTPEARPGAGLEDKVGLFNNACRNPDGESRAWCYTTDPRTRWDYCDIPRC